MAIPHSIWLLVTILRFSGLPLMFAGFAVFGVYFVRENALAARAGDGNIPASSWQGAGPKMAMAIFAMGAGMLFIAHLFAMYLPTGV
jgi:hypothetical protein